MVVSSDKWSVGVIGIIASRLKDIYNKPSIVIAWRDGGIGKASCRSITGIDLGAKPIEAEDKTY